MTGCYVSMGLFASSLTDNQIIAAVISFGLALFMWIIGWGAQAAGSGIRTTNGILVPDYPSGTFFKRTDKF